MTDTTTEPESAVQGPAQENEAAKFTSSDAHIKELKVAELQEICKLLGSEKKGKKKELQDKLIKARENGATYLSAVEMAEDTGQNREGMINDGFGPRARWKILEPDTSVVYDDELEVAGEIFRGPSVPHDEFLRTGKGGGGQRKFNFPQEFQRKEFKLTALLPKMNQRTNKATRNAEGGFIYASQETNSSVPNFEFCTRHGLNIDSKPHEFINAFIPR